MLFTAVLVSSSFYVNYCEYDKADSSVVSIFCKLFIFLGVLAGRVTDEAKNEMVRFK